MQTAIIIVTLFTCLAAGVAAPWLPGSYKTTPVSSNSDDVTIKPTYVNTKNLVSGQTWLWVDAGLTKSIISWNGTMLVMDGVVPVTIVWGGTVIDTLVFLGKHFKNQANLPTSGITLSGGGLALHQEGPIGGVPPANAARLSGIFTFSGDITDNDRGNVRDGKYGTSYSWLGSADSPSFIGLSFVFLPNVSVLDVTGVAFGRDNLGQRSDRTLGEYTIQYTRVILPGAGTKATGDPETGWADIGTLSYTKAGTGLFTNPSLRHAFTFTSVSARGIRLVVPASGQMCVKGTCVDLSTDIDEFEVNPPLAIAAVSSVPVCSGATTELLCLNCVECATTCTWGATFSGERFTGCAPACVGTTSLGCNGECSWDTTFSACKSASAFACGWGLEKVCTTVVQGCAFNTSTNRCAFVPNPNCLYSEKAACTRLSTCQWTNGTCSVIPSSGCWYPTATACAAVSGCFWNTTFCDVSYNTATPCGYGDQETCGSVSGCKWDDIIIRCRVSEPAAPCGYEEKKACNSVQGCVFNASCLVVVNDQCRYDDSVLCKAQKCAWSADDLACTKDCATPKTQALCNGKCFWNIDSGTCHDSLRCPEIQTSTTCDKYPIQCVYNNVTKMCDTLSTPCEELPNAQDCESSTRNCKWYDTASPPCFSLTGVSCSLQTTRGNCVGRSCAWSGSTCAQPIVVAQCEKALTEKACFGFSIQCYWNIVKERNVCANVHSLSTEAVPMSGFRTLPLVPQPGQSFTVEFFGRDIRSGDLLNVVEETSQCPDASDSTAWAQATPITTFDSERLSYTSKSLSLAAGRYTMCVRSRGEFRSSLLIKAASVSVTRATTTPVTPYAKVIFRITFVGLNFLKSNRFKIVMQNEACATWDEMQEILTHGENSATGTGYVANIGTYDVCYSGIVDELIRLQSVVTVTTVAMWKDEAYFTNVVNSKVFTVVLANGARLPYNQFHTNSICRDDNGTRVIMEPTTGTLAFGESQRPYSAMQVCPYIVSPYNQEDGTKTMIMTLRRVYVDDTDYLMIFAPGNGSRVKTPLVPSSNSLGECPVSMAGYSVYASYTYTAFSQADASQLILSLPFPEGCIVVFCSGVSPRLTGFTLSYVTQKTNCLNDCSDNTGAARGACTAAGICVCDNGYAGTDCSELLFCSGMGSQSPVLRSPMLTLSVDVKSTDTCGYQIHPEPQQDTSLERMGTFFIAIQITGLRIQNPDRCNSSYVLIRQDSAKGAVIDTLCTYTSLSTIYFTKGPRAYLQFAPSSAADGFVLTYKVVTDICPGHVAPGAAKPSKEDECDGYGVCEVTDPTPPTSIITLGHYLKSCKCLAQFGLSRAIGTCDVCGFGYRQDTYPNCTDSVKCVEAFNECGENRSVGFCKNGTCSCEANYFGYRCTEYLSPEFRDTLELLPNLKVRFSMNSATATNSGSSKIPDTSLFPCQLKGAQFKCEATQRDVGKVYREGAKAVRQRREEPDLALNFNAVIVDNAFKDVIRTIPVRGTDLDMPYPFTLTSWVKVGPFVSGFLVAKTDAVFTSSGSSPTLDKALKYVIEDGQPTSSENSYDGLNLYFALHLNGRDKVVSLIIGHVVRKFRIADTVVLFDNQWRYLVLTVGNNLGRLEAQIYINGKTDGSSYIYVQCLPFGPTVVAEGMPGNQSDSFNTVVPGGALLFGYHFQGSLDEVRMYNTRLDPFTIVHVAGAFEEELKVQKDSLYAIAGIGIAFLFISLSFPLYRFIRRGCKISSKRERIIEKHVERRRLSLAKEEEMSREDAYTPTDESRFSVGEVLPPGEENLRPVVEVPDPEFSPHASDSNRVFPVQRKLKVRNTIKVLVRKRPMADDEPGDDVVEISKSGVVEIEEEKVSVDLTEFKERHTFTFDNSFTGSDSNSKVYNSMINDKEGSSSLIDTVFNGQNVSCFAYGQTGSGKTFTMMGAEDCELGLFELAARDIFSRVSPTHKISVSIYEIYCNSLFDLLNKRAVLQVREDALRKINICGLTYKKVINIESLLKVVNKGASYRRIASNGLNEQSSRSHAIIRITLHDTKSEDFCGSFSLVDLAGSERLGADTITDKKTKQESAEINKSLLALKECFRALDERKKHVPFRGSKLTEVLREAFQGKSRTVMIATVCPTQAHIEHTLHTLRYAYMVKGLHEDVKSRRGTVLPFAVSPEPVPVPAPDVHTSPQDHAVILRRSLNVAELTPAERDTEVEPLPIGESHAGQSSRQRKQFSAGNKRNESDMQMVGELANSMEVEEEEKNSKEKGEAGAMEYTKAVGQIETTGVTFYKQDNTGGSGSPQKHSAVQSQGGIAATAMEAKDIRTAFAKATEGFRNAIGVALKEFLLRIEISRDVWQVITLFFTSITFPFDFTDTFGRISAIFAVDFTFVYDIDIVITFYLGVALVLSAFIIFFVVTLLEKPKSADQIQELHMKARGDQEEAHKAGKVYEPPGKTAQEMVTFLSLFAVSTLYLPVTRNSIQIIWCHRSVQCALDCTLTDERYRNAFIVSVVTGIVVSIMLPTYIATIIHRKREEFRLFLANNEHEDVEEEWCAFVGDDLSPYKTIYSGFEFKYMYFYVLLMVLKAVMCIPVLALPSDSIEQLAAVLAVQCTFTVLMFATSPFLLDVCDYILQIGQTYVLFTLVISCFYRADPTNAAWAYILNITAFLNLAVQLFLSIKGLICQC